MPPARPWTAHYEPGVPLSLPPVDGPFHAALREAAAGAPGYPALTFFNRSISYAELDALTDRVASALLRDGLELGDRVLIALPTSPLLAVSCLGTLKAGGVAAPVSPDLDEPGIQLAVARATPRLAVVAPRAARAVWAALAFDRSAVVIADVKRSLPPQVRLLARLAAPRRTPRAADVAGARSWAAWLKSAGPHPDLEIATDAPALLVCPDEPGASGQLLTHRHLVAGAAQVRAWLTDAIPGDDTWLLLAPLWRGLGFVAGFGAAMALRAQLALLPRLSVPDVLDALRYLRPTYVVASRTVSAQLADDPGLARADLRSVRAWLTAQPLDEATVRAFEEVAGFSLCEGYGPPGVAGLAVCNPVNGRRAKGSIGIPLTGVDVRLVGPDGRPVGPGEAGVLALAGPNIVTSGWLPTDLVARSDEAGFLYPAGDSREHARSAIL